MEKQIKTLIIPDVHGREFWIAPVTEVLSETDAHIVFLGDYHDPYPREWDEDADCRTISLERFRERVDIAREHPDRITLLIGNHDCGYCIGEDICSSRWDRRHYRELGKIFDDNHDLFKIAEEYDVAGKHVIFSHAGILRGWANSVWGKEVVDSEGFNVVDELNKAWNENTYSILNALGDYDKFRGWGGMAYGSPVWSDILAWTDLKPEETFGYNIVGHTQCVDKPIIFDTIADLDCRGAFYLDYEGNIRDYNTDEIQEKTIAPLENE